MCIHKIHGVLVLNISLNEGKEQADTCIWNCQTVWKKMNLTTLSYLIEHKKNNIWILENIQYLIYLDF